MTVTLNGVDLGKIETITSDKSEVIAATPITTKDSNHTVTVSVSGALRNLTVKGKLQASTVALLITARNNLDALVNGNQRNRANLYALSIDVAGVSFLSINVKVQNCIWDYDVEHPFIIEYTLKLIEGGSS